MIEPRDFQKLSIKKIADVFLNQKNGEKKPRFLLADEVGLGKTIVAQGVIDEIYKKNDSRTNIIYFSCNMEIANQNYSKLFPDGTAPSKEEGCKVEPVNRLTLFPFIRQGDSDIQRKRKINIYSFTPGTSLTLGRSTGIAEERVNILKLMMLYFGDQEAMIQVPQIESNRLDVLSELLRCNVEPRNWESKLEVIKQDLTVNSNRDYVVEEVLAISNPCQFLDKLFSYYDKNIYDYIKNKNIKYSESISKRRGIFDALAEIKENKLIKNGIIKILREGVAITAIEVVSPDLIIMDEFQRFEELLYVDVDDEGNIVKGESIDPLVKTLITERNYPLLLLSATPFTILSPDIKAQLKSFKSLFTMLSGKEDTAKELSALFKQYRKSIKNEIGLSKESALRGIINAKKAVEDKMSRFICRTERNVFEPQDSIKDIYLHHELWADQFEEEHLKEYFDIEADRKALVTGKNNNYIKRMGIEFWKTGQQLTKYCAEFGYQWYTDIYKGKTPNIRKEEIKFKNPKVRYLAGLVKGYNKCLWVLPSARMAQIKTIDPGNPFLFQHKKYLIFSSWIFLPEMLSDIFKDYLKDMDNDPKRRPFAASTLVRFFLPKETHSIFEDEQKIDKLLEMLPDESSLEGGEDTLKSKLRDGLKLSAREKTIIEEWYPGNALYMACKKYLIPKNGEKDFDEEFKLQVSAAAVGALRSFFENPYRASIIESTILGSDDYPDKLLKYLQLGFFHEVIDEYIYTLSHEYFRGTSESLSDVFEVFSTALGLRPSARGARIVLNFTAKTNNEGTSERKKNVRIAFNSPFHPFIVATTSIGQEGLDFHEYCQDIIHWDIPHTPEALEQREGRIRRFKGRAQRMGIAADLVNKEGHDPASFDWIEAFKKISEIGYCVRMIEKMSDLDRRADVNPDCFKLGMYPDWVYQGSNSGVGKTFRHIMTFPFSNDEEKYKRLIERLKIYRMVLGQNRPLEMLDEINKLKENFELEDNELKNLSINLRPNNKKWFKDILNDKIKKMRKGEGLKERLLSLFSLGNLALRKYKNEIVKLSSETTWKEIKALIDKLESQAKKENLEEITNQELLFVYYLASPYDSIKDDLFEVGLKDDIEEFELYKKQLIGR